MLNACLESEFLNNCKWKYLLDSRTLLWTEPKLLYDEKLNMWATTTAKIQDKMFYSFTFEGFYTEEVCFSFFSDDTLKWAFKDLNNEWLQKQIVFTLMTRHFMCFYFAY